MTFYERKV